MLKLHYQVQTEKIVTALRTTKTEHLSSMSRNSQFDPGHSFHLMFLPRISVFLHEANIATTDNKVNRFLLLLIRRYKYFL